MTKDMSFQRTAAALLAAAFMAGGCQHTIRLDPGSEDASVYVNGDLRGSGVSKFDVEDQYGYPESFVAKVYPASGSAFSVEIAREFDWGQGFYSVGSKAIAGAALLAVQYYSKRDAIDTSPNWPVIMFDLWSPGFFGALILASAPLELFRSFKYRDYYDLEQIHDARTPKSLEQTVRMKTSE